MRKSLLLLLLSFGAYAQQISAEELTAILKKTPEAQVVDVRTPSEFKAGHIGNASNIDIRSSEFSKMAEALDKAKPVYLYCLSGGRTKSAAAKLREMGFNQVIEMPGGMMEWRNKNLPEVKLTVKGEGMSLDAYEAMLNHEGTFLVDFYAEWCAPCKKMKPYIEKISKEGNVKVIRIDADQNPKLMKELGIVGLPVIKVYNHGLKWEHTGFMTETELRARLK